MKILKLTLSAVNHIERNIFTRVRQAIIKDYKTYLFITLITEKEDGHEAGDIYSSQIGDFYIKCTTYDKTQFVSVKTIDVTDGRSDVELPVNFKLEKDAERVITRTLF